MVSRGDFWAGSDIVRVRQVILCGCSGDESGGDESGRFNAEFLTSKYWVFLSYLTHYLSESAGAKLQRFVLK
ncbi:unnamed protein product, partial [Trichogramma brassicae]